MRRPWPWIVMVVLGIFLGWKTISKPVRRMDSRLVGHWKVLASAKSWNDIGTKDSIMFTPEGHLKFVAGEDSSSLKFESPTEWWSDEDQGLHILHPDEDASGWVDTTYEIRGAHLVLKDAVIPFVHAREFVKD